MNGRLMVIAFTGFVIVAASPTIESQSQSKPSFEVASVKPNNSGQRGAGLPPPVGGKFNATNVSLKELIQYAYHIQDFQISGTQGWMNSDRYDVIAKAEDRANEDQIRLMVRSLLAERFKLNVHLEEKQLSQYVLVIAKDGLKMPRSMQDCSVPGDRSMPCGGFRLYQRSQLSGRNVPIFELIDVLAILTGRYVVNNSGLSGNFDIKLQWSPDETLALGAETNAPPDDPGGASLFTALQRQLGLKLESQRGPVPVLTVDRAEKPSSN